MKIQTTRFGELEIEDSKLVTFPFGLPGFENLSSWCILHPEGDIDISWFQSTEDPSVALLTANPDALFPDYDIEVNERDLAPIGVKIQETDESGPDIALRVVVTVNGENQDLTANLRAPILINTATQQGLQLPLLGTNFSVNHPLIVPPMGPGAANGKTNGHHANSQKTNGHKANGHKTNGHKAKGKQANGHGFPVNGRKAPKRAALSVKTNSGMLKSHAANS